MLPEICKTLCQKLGLNVFVETGTDMAESVAKVAHWFAEVDPRFGKITGTVTTGARAYNKGSRPIEYPQFEDVQESAYQVYSVDVCDDFYRDVKDVLQKNQNIHLVKSDSAAFLAEFVATDRARNSRILFFLDAHWGKYWPLRDELKQIVKLDRYAIVIDDFFVPGRSSPARPHGAFGYDFYGGVVLDWGYVRDLFQDQAVQVYYPNVPNRDLRGTVFLFKGYSAAELNCLRDLGFVAVDKEDPVHTRQVRLSPLAYLNVRYLAKAIVPMNLLRTLVGRYQKMGRNQG